MRIQDIAILLLAGIVILVAAQQNNILGRDEHAKNGFFAYQNKRYAEAYELFFKAYLSDTSNTEYLNNAGLAAMEAGDLDRAEETLKMILSLEPKNEAALINMGHVCYKRKRYTDAAQLFVRAAEAAEKVEHLNNAVASYVEAGDWESAAKYAREILAENPGDVTTIGHLEQVNAELRKKNLPIVTIPTALDIQRRAQKQAKSVRTNTPGSQKHDWMVGPCDYKARGVLAFGTGLLYATLGKVEMFTIGRDVRCDNEDLLISFYPPTDYWIKEETTEYFHVFYTPRYHGQLNISIASSQMVHIADSPFLVNVSFPFEVKYENPKIPLLFWGMMMPNDGISHVNANFLKWFARDRDLSLSVEHTIDPYVMADERFTPYVRFYERKLLSEVSSRRPLKDRDQISLTNQFPLTVAGDRAGIRIVYFPWECSSMPTLWVNLVLNHFVTEVWAPTHYVRDAWVSSGAPPEKIHVVPYGVDTEMFSPSVPPMDFGVNRTFKFLFNSGVMGRKGLDLVLAAYQAEFSPEEDVALVMKVAYRGFDSAVWTNVEEIQKKRPDIKMLLNKRPLDMVPSLYTAADCLVQPYRSEGFGLTMLEAMSAGLPVILTGAGAALDFANNDHAYLINATEKPCDFPCRANGTRVWLLINDEKGNPFEPELAHQCMWAEPDVNHLRKLMRHVFENRAEAKEKGRRAREFVKNHFEWENAYQKGKERISWLWHHRDQLELPVV